VKKILLTSAGFETEGLLKAFHGLLTKEPKNVKALFIPTASNFPDAVLFLPKCMNDLLKAGILRENITVFDLHCNIEIDELKKYDVIYFTGGNGQYLLERINNTGFNSSICAFVNSGGIYVGVSAGTCVATNDFPDSLKFINCTVSSHATVGVKIGELDTSNNPHIELSDNNAILILGNKIKIIE